MVKSEKTFSCPHCESEFLKKDVCQSHISDCPERNSASSTTDDSGTTESKNPDTETTAKELPVNRDYNFSDRIPEDIPEYKESGTERTRIMAEIRNKSETNQLPRYLVSGDTGTGKTHLARSIAEERESPMFVIQGKYSLDSSDLLGSPVLVNGETIWTDGVLTKALLASREREVVLLVDEVNRARPESKGILFSALDDRCEVVLDARNGEKIKGRPENLIVIGTINEGSDYAVQDMDKAEKRRFGRKFEVDYLGREHPELEAEIMEERTPVFSEMASKMVQASNEIRDASENPDSVIDSGIPTSALLDWSRTAYSYEEAGIENPVIQAGIDSVVRPVFRKDVIREEAEDILRDYLDSAPFSKEDFMEWSNNPDQFKDNVCEHCGQEFKSKRGVSQHQSQSDCGDSD